MFNSLITPFPDTKVGAHAGEGHVSVPLWADPNRSQRWQSGQRFDYQIIKKKKKIMKTFKYSY